MIMERQQASETLVFNLTVMRLIAREDSKHLFAVKDLNHKFIKKGKVRIT